MLTTVECVARARSETEAAWLLAEARPGARVIAGGTDLMLAMERGRLSPTTLVDVRRAGMSGIERIEGALRIGTATTAAALAASSEVRAHAAGLWESAATLSAPTIRNLATVGGNHANASPAADMVPCTVAMDAEVEVRRGDDVRRLRAADLATAPSRTRLEPTDLITAIVVPLWAPHAFHHFVKVGFRDAQIIAVCSLALSIEVAPTSDGSGVVERIGIALGSVAPRVVRAPTVEAFLRGKRLTQATAREAMRLLGDDIKPIDDLRSTAAYRLQVSRSFLGDALTRAHAWARGNRDAATMERDPAPRPTALAAQRTDPLGAVDARARGTLEVKPSGPLSYERRKRGGRA